jgi:hypothetical protein
MAVNVTIGESKPQEEKPFPKLMKSNISSSIVFFIRARHGVMLYSNDKLEKIGDYDETYYMDKFTDFNEPLTLQNK